ncbi:MAG: glycerophosphodiester phosphodiesterase [Bacteroidia bacterium]|nr:glycerophosphodiester phosphodiesterase [Bacteroidia bacterium]
MKIHGHRGARGLYPENTIQGFIEAINLGVDVLEMDVVISADAEVVVSHEPWMHHQICTQPNGNAISEADSKKHNLFQMPYHQIKQYDCGLLPHPRFPKQLKTAAYKPRLADVIDACTKHCKQYNLKPIGYNIETKCTPSGDAVYHPKPARFVQLLVDVLEQKNVLQHSYIQSFDIRTLQFIKQQHIPVSSVFLADYKADVASYIQTLGFAPDVISPSFNLVDAEMVTYCKQNNMAVIPWTVNEKNTMLQMFNLGVDAIITDYPDVAIACFKAHSCK